MNPTRILTIAGALLMASVIAAPASAFQVHGGARTSVNSGNWQNAHETNVATRQENRTTRESNRQNTVQQVSNNRTNAAENISNNRTNAVNNYNDNHGGWYNDHPVATAAAVTGAVVATAAVVGSIVHSLPPSCSAMSVNGMTYQQCGSTWYQPQYAGTAVQYVAVNPPR